MKNNVRNYVEIVRPFGLPEDKRRAFVRTLSKRVDFRGRDLTTNIDFLISKSRGFGSVFGNFSATRTCPR